MVKVGALACFLFGCATLNTAVASTVENWGFEDGSLAGWSTFDTENGVTNYGGIVDFDTEGTDLDPTGVIGGSSAPMFNVGQVSYATGDFRGGGIFRNFSVGSTGEYGISANVAAYNPHRWGNYSGGLFELFIDGNMVASTDTGRIDAFATERDIIEVSQLLTVGIHELRLMITRPFLTRDDVTPFQFIDDITISSAASLAGPSNLSADFGLISIPVPQSLLLFLTGLLGLGIVRWRRKP